MLRGRGAWVAIGALLLTATASMPLVSYLPSRIIAAAYQVEQRGVDYSWGGGHAGSPGPSTGTCRGYQGKIKPCPATRTRGLDCSGFTRWVYALALGNDVLGPGNTDDHLRRLRRVSPARPGDLVFFGKPGRTHHVGIYLGNGMMMNAPETGAKVRVDGIAPRKDLVGFFRY